MSAVWERPSVASEKNIIKFGCSRQGCRQPYRCKTCEQAFCETTGTLLHGRKTPEAKIIECLAMLAKGHYDIALLDEELLNLYEWESDKQAVSLFLNWFRQLALYGKVPPEDYAKLDIVYRTKEEVETMLVATLEQSTEPNELFFATRYAR